MQFVPRGQDRHKYGMWFNICNHSMGRRDQHFFHKVIIHPIAKSRNKPNWKIIYIRGERLS